LHEVEVGFGDVLQAAELLAGIARETPALRCRSLDERVRAEVVLKCESFQRMGAFKFRGAYNAMSRLSEEEKRRGVVTHSSGNHAQAVALAGRLLGVETTVVMPSDAPAIKRAATEGYGAKVVPYDVGQDTRERISHELAKEHGFVLVPPFDHPHIVAGAGTAALELCREEGPFDLVLAPCGGGGLLSGTALAAKGVCPDCQVVGVEPELADDAARSFETGVLQTVKNPRTIADGTRTASLGELTFRLIRQHVDGFARVSECAITDAVRFLFERAKLVVEPSGALGVAALLSGGIEAQGRVGVIISGGNVDPETMARILRGEV
jgi:threo-3-hydroxy-L-aspartate ammonia-lyase